MTDHGSSVGETPGSGLPAVQVVRGQPDELEVAALVAGLAATASTDESEPVTPDPWLDHGRRVPGAQARRDSDAWRWSLRD